MSSKTDEITELYARMQTYELLERFLTGDITDEARRIALAEFERRGVDPSDPGILVKAQAEAEIAAEMRRLNPTPEEITQQETGRLIQTILLVTVIPVVAWILGYISEMNLQPQFAIAVTRHFGATGLDQMKSLSTFCESGGSQNESICERLAHISWLQQASVGALAIGILVMVVVVIAARRAANDRQVLLNLFSPLRVGMLYILFFLTRRSRNQTG